jgi:chromosome segregation ATPase
MSDEPRCDYHWHEDRINSLEALVKEREQEVVEYADSNESLVFKMAHMEDELYDKCEEIKRLEAKAEQAEQKIRNYDDEFVLQKATIERLEKRVKELEAEVERDKEFLSVDGEMINNYIVFNNLQSEEVTFKTTLKSHFFTPFLSEEVRK